MKAGPRGHQEVNSVMRLPGYRGAARPAQGRRGADKSSVDVLNQDSQERQHQAQESQQYFYHISSLSISASMADALFLPAVMPMLGIALGRLGPRKRAEWLITYPSDTAETSELVVFRLMSVPGTAAAIHRPTMADLATAGAWEPFSWSRLPAVRRGTG